MAIDKHPTSPPTVHLTDLSPNHLVIWVTDTNQTRKLAVFLEHVLDAILTEP